MPVSLAVRPAFVVLLMLTACVESGATTLVAGNGVFVASAVRDAGPDTPDAGRSECREDFEPPLLCSGPCDDGDPCTDDACSAATGFTCLFTPTCPGSLCVAGQCVTQLCTPRLALFGPCAGDDGEQCTVLLDDGGTAQTGGTPGRLRVECSPDEECTPEGTTCLPAPSRTLIVWPLDGGGLLSDGGLSVDVAVYGVRTGADTSFQLRPVGAALQAAGIRPATRLTFPPSFTWKSGWAWVVRREGESVLHAEPQVQPGWLCELYDCLAPPPYPLRNTPSGVWIRQASAGEARFGGGRPAYEASGDYVVHVFTFFDGAPPAWSFGHALATLPAGCDPAIDVVRKSWNQWARSWTNGALSLPFSFVDHGVMPLPDDATLGRLGRSSGPLDEFRNEAAVLRLANLQLPQRGPRELILVGYVGVSGFAGGGRAGSGVALVRIPRERGAFTAGATLHELGHLFGAVDLYNGSSPTGCAPEQSVEFMPDLYCWASGVSRLNARELGWLLPDGGAAQVVTHTCQSPTSSFGCDPD